MKWLILILFFQGCSTLGYEEEPAKFVAPDKANLNTYWDRDNKYAGTMVGLQWELGGND